MRACVQVDFSFSMPLKEALTLIESFKGTLESAIAEGPGGGNPCLTISFKYQIEAMRFLRHHFPKGESESFLRSLIYLEKE